MLELCGDMVKEVPLFQNTVIQDTSGFYAMLVTRMNFMGVPKDEWIVRKGEIGSEMYFVLKVRMCH